MRVRAPTRCQRLLLLLLAVAAGVLPRARGQAALLRPPGVSVQSDTRVIIAGTAADGAPAFLAQFTPVFTDYLNAVLGAALGKTFSTVALSLEETNDAVGAASLDFVFSYPSHFTCLSAQHGARTIATVQRARRVPAAPATPVPLSVFGGVFFALANRSDIATLQDIAGQRLEGTDVTSLGAGQAQWAELASRGLSFWNMPSEVIFSGNQYTVIADVAAGTADVGMVRTDLLETVQLPPPYCNATAAAAIGLRCYPAGTFKILEPRLVAGYPFNSSTQLWPEWPVAALPHVDVAIQKAVTQALFEFGTAAASLPFAALGEVASFVPALDYMGVRDMLHAQGWIVNGSCLAAARVQDSIVCPPGSFKRAADAIARTCLERGLLCPADHECVCAPCQALPAQQLTVALAPAAAPGNATVCARMRICATPQQNDALLLTVTDNWADARAGLGLPPVLSVLLKFDATLTQIDDQSWLTAPPTGNGTWALRIPTPRTGFFLVEAEADGTALDASPLVVSVVPPVCAGLDAAPDVEGVCVCAKRHVAEGPRGDCVAVPAFSVTAVAAGSAAGAAALVLLIAAVVLLMHRRAEALWRISHSAVTFLDPPEVLGRGTFGLVVKGTYRGTTVALKRSLPMEPRSGSTNGTGANTGASKPVGGMASRNSSDRLSQFDLQALNEFAQGDRAPTPKAASETPRAAPRLSGSGNGAITVRVTGGGSRSGGCTRSGSRSTSATGASSVLPVFCAGACPALDGLLGALWRRRKAAALRADFIREMRLLVHLRHPHILTVLGAVLHESEPILVMEHMDRGSLHDLLHNETLPLDGDVVLQLLRDIVSGMEFLHSADPPVLHNDLKAANVLVDASFRAKVSDFGLSGKRRASRGPPGTPFWMAPELLRRHGRKRGAPPSTATDVYALGVTMSEVFNRAEPYIEQQMTMDQVLACVGAAERPLRPHLGDSVPVQFAELMRRCWHPEPACRPSMTAIAAELRLAADQEGVGAAKVTVAMDAARHRHAGERKLLSGLFPPAVAAALAEGRRVEPQEFSCVTVFFSDVVGFTDLCAVMSPAKVMAMLDRLYHAFDLLTAQHGLYKVETIGDAFMVCGALTAGQEGDHAARVAAFALAAVAAASTIAVDEDDPAAGCLTVRAGFHSGPVVASVIGRTNPRYCLFGDTVNCANRMESNSAPGRVTASPAAAALLRQQAPSAVLLSRGVVPIKGKGPMELFWLMQVAPLVQPRGSTPAANSRAAASRGGTSTGGARISG